MADADSRDAFRRQATRIHRIVLGGLAILLVAAVALGWRLGGWLGWTTAIVGIVVAAFGAVAATFIWAMSQDGG